MPAFVERVNADLNLVAASNKSVHPVDENAHSLAGMLLRFGQLLHGGGQAVHPVCEDDLRSEQFCLCSSLNFT